MPAVEHAFRRQADACRRMGSDLYSRLLEVAAADIAAGGPTAALMSTWTGNPYREALALRLMGGVHDLVLDGRAPDLARHYPSVGGSPAWPGCAEAFLGAVDDHPDHLQPWIDRPVQTNEPARSALLLGGYLTLARRTGLPLRILEVGASAGLNLLFDRYRYDLRTGTWGDPASPVLIRSDWRGAPPPLDFPLAVAARAGCDRSPLDARDPAAARRAVAYVWPDQPERLERLRGALDVAAAGPPDLAEADAGVWLADRLLPLPAGIVTVVVHTVVWQYLDPAAQQRVATAIAAGAAAASDGAPLAWLRLEPKPKVGFPLELTTWPGGDERVLAACHAHGAWADWA